MTRSDTPYADRVQDELDLFIWNAVRLFRGRSSVFLLFQYWLPDQLILIDNSRCWGKYPREEREPPSDPIMDYFLTSDQIQILIPTLIRAIRSGMHFERETFVLKEGRIKQLIYQIYPMEISLHHIGIVGIDMARTKMHWSESQPQIVR